MLGLCRVCSRTDDGSGEGGERRWTEAGRGGDRPIRERHLRDIDSLEFLSLVLS